MWHFSQHQITGDGSDIIFPENTDCSLRVLKTSALVHRHLTSKKKKRKNLFTLFHFTAQELQNVQFKKKKKQKSARHTKIYSKALEN